MTTLPELLRYAPANEEEAASIVARVAKAGTRLTIRGGGSRTALGRPVEASAVLSSEKLSGIAFYSPEELAIGVRAGTFLKDVEAALTAKGQMLAFEPMDHRALLNTKGDPTIGGVAAVNASGPRRIQVGAARDSLLGIRMVNGRGEIVKSGGRVMKNVTGLDLVKLVCGAYGTLGFLTEIVFKVLPAPKASSTLVVFDLDDATAIAALSLALGSPFEPTGAAHLPAGMGDDRSRTLLRLEGFPDAVDYRIAAMAKLVATGRKSERVDRADSAALWRRVRDAAFVAEPRDAFVWRVSTASTNGPSLAEAIGRRIPAARWFYDWGGGLLWIAIPPSADAGAPIIRGELAAFGGHATLVRAPDSIRHAIPVFQPAGDVEMRLSTGIKASFDPAGIFEPGRMQAGI